MLVRFSSGIAVMHSDKGLGEGRGGTAGAQNPDTGTRVLLWGQGSVKTPAQCRSGAEHEVSAQLSKLQLASPWGQGGWYGTSPFLLFSQAETCLLAFSSPLFSPRF